MDLPRTPIASVPMPPLVETLRRKREQWLATLRVRRGPSWVGLNAALSFAAQRATRWARFTTLLAGNVSYPWAPTSMEYFFPLLPPLSLPATVLSTATREAREGVHQRSRPRSAWRTLPLMWWPSEGRRRGDDVPLPSEQVGMRPSWGVDPLQEAGGQGIPAVGPAPPASAAAPLFSGQGRPGDPITGPRAEPVQATALPPPSVLRLASLSQPLHTPRRQGIAAAAPAPLPRTALRLTSGTPLEPTLRARLEPLLGFDLGRVRLHTDSAAASLAFRLRAHAFTVGPHIFFAAGRFQPQTRPGLTLLTHELTHVGQQPDGAPWLWGRLTSTAHRALEQEAHAQADAVLARSDPPAESARSTRSTPMSWGIGDISGVAATPGDGGMALPPLVLSYTSRALAVVPLRQEMTEGVPNAPVSAATTPATASTSPAAEMPDPEKLAQQVYEWIQRRQRLERERRGIQQWH
jgi:hypothetical protein